MAFDDDCSRYETEKTLLNPPQGEPWEPAIRTTGTRGRGDPRVSRPVLPAALLAAAVLAALSGCRSFSASRARTETPSTVAARVAGRLSTRQKIGQHFIGWVPKQGITQELRELVEDGLVGGIILYPWNYDSVEQVRSMTSQLQRLATGAGLPVRLFLCADQEGGRVAALRFKEITAFPSAYNLGRHGDAELVRSAAYITGREMSALGLNMNFAPVLDLYGEPDSSIIGDRAFGPDPAGVAGLGAAYVRGAKAAGIIPVAKHFPGHGRTPVDSHGALPIVHVTEEELIQQDLVPFARVIDEGIDAVMTAHLLIPEIDPRRPVTLSTAFIGGLLRDRLGFQGVVISDGLAMGALSDNYAITDVVAGSFNAAGTTATWTPSALPTFVAGAEYVVQVNWGVDATHATAAEFAVNHAGGSTVVAVDQTQNAAQGASQGVLPAQPPGQESGWFTLGQFTLDGSSNVTLAGGVGNAGSL